jgi:tetratricopeptide (TPR) repeat protein
MNKSEFAILIHQPEQPGTAHIQLLKNVCSEYPYFVQAHVLLAKSLHNTSHYEFDKHLKQTALLVPDREVLYQYIHQANKQKNITTPASVEVFTANDGMVETEPEIGNQDQPLSETVHIEHEHVLTDQPEAADMLIENTEITAVDKIQTAEISQVLESAQLIPIEEEKKLASDEPAKEQITATELSTENVIENHKTEIHSFSEWLMLADSNQVTPSAKGKTIEVEQQVKEEIAAVTSIEESSVAKVENHQTTEQAEEENREEVRKEIAESVTKSNVNQFHDILDKFIKENPSITRPRAEFFNPVNMAKQSVEEDEDLVTETLANLYYKQGNHRKAIRAYEKLCLIYPSKMTYFASLIQKIKSEIKD